jgi:hypothetical protein
MIVDLRGDGVLDISDAKEINDIEPSIRVEYNTYIEELLSLNKAQDLTWLLQVTSRNTHKSLIHDSFCRIKLLDNILKKVKTVDKVYIDSKFLKSACEQVIKINKSDAIITIEKSSYFDSYIINLIKSCVYLCYSYFVPKFIVGRKNPLGPIVYIENFIFIDSFNQDGSLIDRYYPGLLQGVSNKKIKNKIWYVPTLIGIKTLWQYISIFKSIRKCKGNFILKEDFLTLSDYMEAFKISITLSKSIKNIPLWNNINVSDIINNELILEKGSPALINTILMYIFIKRLSLGNIDISLVIDWNENQVIDRAINLGFRKYYPGVKIKGYQGYVVPDYYACKDPTCYEIKAGTVPDEICVIGQGFVEGKKKYCKEINVSVAPAFRFSGIYGVERHDDLHNSVLVILPISLKDSKNIILMCNNFLKLTNNKYELILKQHPSYTVKNFIKLVPELLNPHFKVSNKPVHKLLANCDMLISSWSSVCLEAAVLGIPVAISGSLSGPSMNPLYDLKEVKKWKICYNEKDLLNFIEGTSYHSKININNYFSPVTTKSINDFICS